MKTRLEAMDKVIKIRKEQDLQLRDSIYMATREVNGFSLLPSQGVQYSMFI